MNTLLNNTSVLNIKKLFSTYSSLPFKLLVFLLVFNSFRPDKLLPGGSVLLHIPTLILLVLLLLWIQTPKKVLGNPQTKLFLGFLIIMTLGTILARNKSWAFNQLKSMFLYGFIFYLMIVQYIDTSFKVEKYVRLYLVLSLFLVVMGITNKGWVRIPLLEDENEFALFTNCLIPITYFLGQEASVKWKKVFYYSLIIFLILGTIITFSRGGLVGLCSVGLFIFSKSKHKISILFLVGIFVSTILFIGLGSGQQVRHAKNRGQLEYYWDDMATIFSEGGEKGTGKERVESWKAGWAMFLDNPILGVGPNNFGMWLADYYVPYGPKKSENMWGRAAHSLYFTLLPETGFAGTLFFALILWRNYKDHQYIVHLEKRKAKLLNQANLTKEDSDLVSTGIRRLYYFSLGYSGAIIAFLATGTFISVLWYSYFWMFTSFWAMSSNLARNIEQILLERNNFGSSNSRLKFHNTLIHKRQFSAPLTLEKQKF